MTWNESSGASINLTNAQSNPVLSFGRFHESGGFPKGWPFGRARRREIPQRPDLIRKDWTKRTNHRQPSGILNIKAHAHCFIGFATLWGRCLIGMNPFMGFSSASSGPQAGLPHNQSRQIGHPPNLIPHTANLKKRKLQSFDGQTCAGFKISHLEYTFI